MATKCKILPSKFQNFSKAIRFIKHGLCSPAIAANFTAYCCKVHWLLLQSSLVIAAKFTGYCCKVHWLLLQSQLY
jgi:hypothetical protein